MLTWGYAGVAHGDLRWWDGDQTINKLTWCRKNGFRSTGVDLKELAEPTRRAAVLAAGEGLRLDVHWACDWYALDAAECDRRGEAFVRDLERHRSAIRCPFVGSGLGGKHRFDGEWPVARQIERVAAGLRGTARRLADIGCPLAVHNAFDWWGSDLAELCRATPGLGVLFDTGNSLVVGERPLDMARHVAPFVVATHIKDHILYPWNDPRGKAKGLKGQALVVDGAVLGEGHAEVRAVVDHLLDHVRDPQAVIWGWELEPPEGMNGQEAVDRSWAVIREIESAYARRTGAGAAACAR